MYIGPEIIFALVASYFIWIGTTALFMAFDIERIWDVLVSIASALCVVGFFLYLFLLKA